jgi:predicted negative regulator of RcsB-dependent stress response
MHAPQEQLPAPAGQPTSLWDSVLAFGREPGVVEVLLAVVLLGGVLLFWWRLASLVRNARARDALADYLLGVEQALHGDLDGAFTRLSRVVQHDPQNHYARLLLGKVLAERGEPEQAHQQHLLLKSAFGIDSAENDLMLAQSLLAAGLPQEAAEAAERALQKAPERSAAWDFVYRARLQHGDFEAAAAAGRRLLAAADGPRQKLLAQDLARTLAQAGGERLRRQDAAGARALLQESQRLGGGSESVALLAARLEAEQRGPAAIAATLALQAGADSSRALVATAAQLPATRDHAAAGLPAPTLAGLVAPERWSCRACSVPLVDAVPECPRCAAKDPARLEEPRLCGELMSPSQTMDAIEANEAHLQRLVHQLLEGPDAARDQARGELLELRERAVTAVLRAAWHLAGNDQDRAIAVLRSMGPSIVPALFAASDELEQQRLLPIGSRSPAALVGRVVQGFDRTALPHFQSLFAGAKAEHRKILIDFFLGLADLGEFQLVLERFPPMEILHRLNKADAAVLRRFLQAVPAGHFVAETLLLEPTFYRDDQVLAAIPGAAAPEVLVGVLRRRGATRTLSKVLLEAVSDPALADVAERVFGELGPDALEHALAAFADPELAKADRTRLQRVLVRGGAAIVDHLIDSFGPEPTAFDDQLRDILIAIGEPAVPMLKAAYDHSGWLEKVSIGLISRHTNRRVQIVLTLYGLDSAAARAALHGLLQNERDHNLRLRLQQALHEPPGGGDGQAR